MMLLIIFTCADVRKYIPIRIRLVLTKSQAAQIFKQFILKLKQTAALKSCFINKDPFRTTQLGAYAVPTQI